MIEAIFTDQQQIRERIEDISIKLNTKFAAVDARIDDLSERYSRLEGSVASIRGSIDSSATASSALSDGMILHELEERQRRSSNLIFLNIPESLEGQQPDDTQIISTLLGLLSVDTSHLRVRRLGVRSGELDSARGRLLLAVLGTAAEILSVGSLDLAVSLFNLVIHDAITRFVPWRARSSSSYRRWVSGYLRHLIGEKKRAHALYKSSRMRCDYPEFRALRSCCKLVSNLLYQGFFDRVQTPSFGGWGVILRAGPSELISRARIPASSRSLLVSLRGHIWALCCSTFMSTISERA